MINMAESARRAKILFDAEGWTWRRELKEPGYRPTVEQLEHTLRMLVGRCETGRLLATVSDDGLVCLYVSIGEGYSVAPSRRDTQSEEIR